MNGAKQLNDRALARTAVRASAFVPLSVSASILSAAVYVSDSVARLSLSDRALIASLARQTAFQTTTTTTCSLRLLATGCALAVRLNRTRPGNQSRIVHHSARHRTRQYQCARRCHSDRRQRRSCANDARISACLRRRRHTAYERIRVPAA